MSREMAPTPESGIRDEKALEGYRETEMCGHCRGKCCRLQPGHCLPSEFGSAAAVQAAFNSGKYGIILLLDSDIKARVVRPHYRDRERQTGCVFLREKGCELPWQARPYGCRMLRPKTLDGEHCAPEGISIAEAGRMWERSGFLPAMPSLGFD